MLRAYAQLLRIPNVFTAWADICMAWMVSGGLSTLSNAVTADEHIVDLACLLWASSCLYSAGMMLNDYFDVELDRRERPHRPIPSGRVDREVAGGLGGLLVGAALLPLLIAGLQAFSIAVFLAFTILLYDGWLKRTWLGPLGMGLCRFLNVLLGMSTNLIVYRLVGGFNREGIVSEHSGLTGRELWMLHIAAVVGLYIVGVTWFARTEAVESKRGMLIAASMVMVAALIAAVVVPIWWAPSDRWEVFLYPYLLVVWMMIVGTPVIAAIRQPQPQRVQRAVKWCILGLIGLDTLLAFAVVGWPGLLILLLLPPALLLGRWVYST